MTTRFVLLSTQRSGSTWVVDMLNSHPAVQAYEELFLRDWKEKPTWAGARDILTWNAYWDREQTRFNKLARPRAYFEYLNQVYSPKDKAVAAVGFKLMYGQVRRQRAILMYMLWHKVSIVHLIRSNFLDVILSEKATAIRGVPHARGEVDKVQITLDTSNLLSQLNWKDKKVRWARRIFSHLGLPYLEVTYEELLSEKARFGAVLNFIKSDHQQLSTALKKLNKGSYKELIENYDAVKKTLEGTKYYQLLHK